ncbi:MAG: threonylcarbamoyl-AMP synthase [Clostridia bacterium]|nr:threonylcarbamoyl-AMP synthase [Clostridia bacterium]
MITARLTDDKKGIDTAADILKADGVVAIPTETVYGLAASAFSDEAIEKVFVAKGRPQDNPLIVHISDIDMISSAVSEFSPTAKTLADAFWPGPLTLVLKKNEKIAESVSRGLDTVAVRMPSHKVAREVIKAAGIPLAAPSANISGSPSPTTAEHVIADLDGRIDAVIMSGSSEVGVESTVVSLATEPPRLLRPGRVTAEELMEYIPNLVIDKAVLSEPEKGEKVASPGMKYKHYSPKTEVILISGSEEAFANFVNLQENCLAICFTEDEKSLACDYLSYGAKADGEAQAKSIFSLLRKADTLGKDKIYIHAPEKTGVSLAVYNRLIRAAAFRVIEL